MGKLSNRKIAILSEQGFEEVELTEPVKRLKEEGATTHVISSKSGTIKAWNKTDWSIDVDVDAVLGEVNADDYDGLVLPGGVINPDILRVNEDAIALVKDFFKQGKPVAAICHGPQTLINARVVKGREMTSVENIREDLQNAGANWVDAEVVVDQGLVTSRTPEDLPAFLDKMVEEFAEGIHDQQQA